MRIKHLFLSILIGYIIQKDLVAGCPSEAMFSGDETPYTEEVSNQEEPSWMDGCEDYATAFLKDGHILTIGPEFYNLTRIRHSDTKTNTKQNGTPIGVRATYDYIKRYKFYCGAQIFWATGILNGKTAGEEKIRSSWTDEQIEGNVGYTFQYKYFPHVSFTPFGGYGYYRETNKFIHPTPVPLKFITKYGYISYGFLSSVLVNSWLSIGVNLRLRSPNNPQCVIKDPDFDAVKLKIGERIQYRIETPLIYYDRFLCNLFQLGLVPFYEKRDYGKWADFPVSYVKTTIQTYGLNLQLIFRF